MKTSTLVKSVRKSLKLTQRQMAGLIGTTRVNIAKYETGATIPPGNVLVKILALRKNNQRGFSKYIF